MKRDILTITCCVLLAIALIPLFCGCSATEPTGKQSLQVEPKAGGCHKDKNGNMVCPYKQTEKGV